MRNRWVGYAASLAAAAVLVAGSAFTPSALLHRQESTILDKVNYINTGYYSKRSYPGVRSSASLAPAPATSALPSATEPMSENQRMLEKMRIFEQSSSGSYVRSEPAPNEMRMKEIVDQCIEQITDLVKAGAILPLENFPSGYKVEASLQSIVSAADGKAFDYWSISFSAEPSRLKTQGGIGMTADAETGKIFSFKMYTSDTAPQQMSLEKAAELLSENLGLKGTTKTVPPDKIGEEAAQWTSDEGSLYLRIRLNEAKDSTSLMMGVGLNPPQD